MPALAVLAVGLAFGAVLLWRVLARARRAALPGAPSVPLQIRDLAGKRDAFLRQIQELEDSASKRTPEQLARERYALELETARVLLALDESRPPEAKRSKAAARRTGRARPAPVARSGRRALLWGAGCAAALLLLGLFVYRSAGPRQAGGSVTGGAPMGGPQNAGDSGGTALAGDPDALEAHLARARLLVAGQDWMGAWNETNAALALQPGNPRGLAYQGLIRVAMGRSDLAVGVLERALSADPGLIDAYAYLALALTRIGRADEAEAVIAQASKRFPDRAGELHGFLASVQKEPAVAEAARFTGSHPNGPTQ
jgi:tetratricopeptide (TPR) repeat protein